MEVICTTEIPSKEELYLLYEQLGWNRFLKLNPEQLLQAMKGSFYSVYAYSGKELIGTGRVISDGIINAYLCGLGVQEKYRHNGVATEIIKQLTKKCRDNKLHMQFFCEEHLVPFYQEKGFTQFAIGMKERTDNEH